MSYYAFEETAEETVVIPVLLFLLGVLMSCRSFFEPFRDVSAMLPMLSMASYLVSFITGFYKRYEVLFGFIVGFTFLSLIYFPLKGDVVVNGISFKQHVNPMSAVIFIVLWFIGWLIGCAIGKDRGE